MNLMEPNYKIKRWLGIRRSTWYFMFYTAFYFSYISLIAIIMSLLEKEDDNRLRTEFTQRLIHKFVNKTFTIHDLYTILDEHEMLASKGVTLRKHYINHDHWNFGSSFLYAVTLVTTIGYGHITPITNAGKTATIIFGIIGIPLTHIFITASVQRIEIVSKSLMSLMMKKLKPHLNEYKIKLLHLIFFITSVIIIGFIIPSCIIEELEPGWVFLDAFYFVFISLSTIGLGDLVPGDNSANKAMYKTVVALYLVLGILLLSLIIGIYLDIPRLNFGVHLLLNKDITVLKKPERSIMDLERGESRLTKENVPRKLIDGSRIFITKGSNEKVADKNIQQYSDEM